MENNYSTGGYQCGVCGEFVMHNTLHVCGGSQIYHYTAGNTNDSNVISKLNEIIELLKTIQRRIS